MKKLKVYLAGTFSDWRDKVIKELHDSFDFYHPLIHSRQGSMIEYVSDDLKAVARSDIIIAYQEKSYLPCYGMAVEASIGFSKGKIIIYIDESGYIDPFLSAISKRQFSSLNLAISFLKRAAKNPISEGIVI